MEWLERSERLIGKNALEKLKNSHIAVFGLGGVGCSAAEALARAGVGRLTLFDGDVYSETNLNRQLFALRSTLGTLKTEAAAERLADINPELEIRRFDVYYLPENAENYPLNEYDYIIDAVDTVSAKLELAVRAKASGVPIISCMGTGNKLDPTAFEVTDIFKTSVCPLARVMRRELKARNINSLTVVYSKETPESDGERVPASVSFVPPVAGFILAGKVITDITGAGK